MMNRYSHLLLINILIIVLTALGFGLRIYELNAYSLWYDELLQVDISQKSLDEIMPHMKRHAAMPLDYFLIHGWIKLGRQEGWVRWLAVLFGTLSIPLIYRLGRHLFSPSIGLIATLLLTPASFAIQYSREVRPYALLMFLVMLAYFGLWQAYKTHQIRYWMLAALGLVGAVSSHYFALFMLLPIGLFVGIQQLRHLKDLRYWGHSGAFALCLLLIVVALALFGRILIVYSVGQGFSRAAMEPERFTVESAQKPNRGTGPPLERSFFQDSVITPLSTGALEKQLIYVIFIFATLTTLLTRNNRNRSAILLLLGWLILPIIAIYLFLLQRGTFYAVRYIVYTLPAFLLLTAYGIDQLVRGANGLIHRLTKTPQPLQPILTILLIILFLLPVLQGEHEELQAYYTADPREDWRAVGTFLNQYAGSDDAIIAPRAEPTMNWYYPSATVPFGHYLNTANVSRAINNHQRRWFILSSYSHRRDKDIHEWLSNNGAVLIGIDRRVVIYLQEAGKSKVNLLAELEDYTLPEKPLTYATLGRQYYLQGDHALGRSYFEKAFALASPKLKPSVQAQLPPQLAALLTEQIEQE